MIERMARMEENQKSMYNSLQDLRNDFTVLDKKLNEKFDKVFTGAMEKLEKVVTDITGKFAQRPWVEALDRRVKEVELWREGVSLRMEAFEEDIKGLKRDLESIDGKIDKINLQVKVAIGIASFVAPIVYFLLQLWISGKL